MINNIFTYILIILFTFTSSVNACYSPTSPNTYTDGLWINGKDTSLGNWSVDNNSSYVIGNTMDWSKVENRDNLPPLVIGLGVGLTYIAATYFSGDGNVIEGNKNIKNTTLYKYTIGAINEGIGYLIGKSVDGLDSVLYTIKVTDNRNLVKSNIEKLAEYYRENVSEASRDKIEYLFDVLSITAMATTVAKGVNAAKSAKASKSAASTSKTAVNGADDIKGVENISTSTNNKLTTNVNSKAALNSKLSELEDIQKTADRVKTLPDGRIRYYKKVRPATNIPENKTVYNIGNSYVVEYNPTTNSTRSWAETYNNLGKITEVHPKSINGQTVVAPHYKQ